MVAQVQRSMGPPCLSCATYWASTPAKMSLAEDQHAFGELGSGPERDYRPGVRGRGTVGGLSRLEHGFDIRRTSEAVTAATQKVIAEFDRFGESLLGKERYWRTASGRRSARRPETDVVELEVPKDDDTG